MFSLNLWTAYERHLRNAVTRLASAHEIAQLPQLGVSKEEKDGNIRSYLEILENRKRNLVPMRPRRVHFSNILFASPRSRVYEPRILEIKRMLETADPRLNDPEEKFFSERMEYLLWSKSVKKTMTKRVKFAAFIDRMLFEWGIRHLHMGGVRRNDDLLFAVIEEEDAYLIDVRTHDNFADTDLLEVADRNWPDLFQFLPVIPGDNFTAEQICNLRANNVGYAVNVNGRALMPKNVATCAGGSLPVTRWMHQIRALLAVHQAQLCAPLSEIRCQIATVLGVAEAKLNFEVVDHDDNFGEFILLRDSQTELGIRYKFR